MADSSREWRPILSLAGNYAASDRGEICRIGGCRKPTGRCLKGHPNRWGYFLISVSLHRKSVTRSIQRLVAEAFHGPPPSDRHQVNHLDGDKLNNRPDNLEWVTQHENMRHAVGMGVFVGERNPNAKLTESLVRSIRARRTRGETYVSIAADLGVTPPTARNVVIGLRWRHVV